CHPLDGGAGEPCDGIDNDGDGLIDEGCPCAGTEPPRGCYPGGLASPTLRYPWDGGGGCSAGAQPCLPGAPGQHIWSSTCGGFHLPKPELCDGYDNDCDGLLDPPECGCNQGVACYLGPIGSLTGTCRPGAWDCARDAGEQCAGE